MSLSKLYVAAMAPLVATTALQRPGLTLRA